MSEVERLIPNEPLTPFLWISAAVVVVVLIVGSSVFFGISGWEVRGQFGDMFGVANSLFSGLAFGALVYTLILQRKELSLQRRELILTRNELKNQSLTQAEHAATALKAARISALGSLLQSYATFFSSGKARLIEGGDPGTEIMAVQKELKALLYS